MDKVIKISELIDKLIGVNIKIHYLHHRIIEEESKKKINHKKVVDLDLSLRKVAEERVVLKNALDRIFKELIPEYQVTIEQRTYYK